MLFLDFEVYAYNWLVVVVDMTTKQEHVIVDNPEQLKALYEANKRDIWVGFNINHYDQYIFKTILLGLDPKEVSDWIIVQKREGWQFSKSFNQIPLITYDVMPNPPIGLKTLEGFMGSDIRETEVAFDLDRPLTRQEIQQTIHYCRHDVGQTIEVFVHKIDDFNAMHGIVKAFDYISLSYISNSAARITAKVLDCQRQTFDDEFDYFILPCVQLKKYKYVQDWFLSAVDDCTKEMKEKLATCKPNEQYKYDWTDDYYWSRYFYSRSLTVDIAGVPHTFGFGGLHGAIEDPVHRTGYILHVDVGSYYPSMLIGWNLVTRAARKPEQYKNVYDTRMRLKVEGKKKEQDPYKKMLNALSGAMKDKTNPAYDPRNNNCMCINGQLMLLDLIEHLEVVPGFELIQSNTDGLIIQIPDTDKSFDLVDDICFNWEQRCSTELCDIKLGLDTIKEIFQKDVNNYLWVDAEGGVERIGAYLKKLSPVDNDLPIINKALVDYMVQKVPVEQTISQCNDLIEFQKVVKLSGKYKWVEQEHCTPTRTVTGVKVKKELLTYGKTVKYTYKSYRVYASRDIQDGRLLKCGGLRGKPEKFANTPEHCFIHNESVVGVKVPQKLDKQWYITLAKKRLEQFGVL